MSLDKKVKNDVRKAIQKSTKVKTLKELAVEGRKSVKVIKGRRITELVAQAVEKAIEERSLDLEEKEKAEITKASLDEFQHLIKEMGQKNKQDKEALKRFHNRDKALIEAKHQLKLSESLRHEDMKRIEEQRQLIQRLERRIASQDQEEASARESTKKEAFYGDVRDLLSTQMKAIAELLAKQLHHLPSEKQGQPEEAAKILLDRLFTESGEIESNLDIIGVKSAEGSSIAQNLERLKSLRKKIEDLDDNKDQ